MPETIPTPITTTVERSDLSCLQCGRVSGYIQDGVRVPRTPEYGAFVLALRCPSCTGGRLIEGERSLVRILRKLTVEELQRKNQGRRPGSAIPPCVDGLCMRPGKDAGMCSACRTRGTRRRQKVVRG